MRAIAITRTYGSVEQFSAVETITPTDPQGYEVIVKIKACSVNPIDTKVRAGIYDDFTDYFDHVPPFPHIIGFDASGVITAVGSQASSEFNFRAGDEVYYSASPTKQGTNAEYHVTDARTIAKKPVNLSWEEAAALPLTAITAFEAVVERLEIKHAEKAAILVINGAGGVGSIASQILRSPDFLGLETVVTTSSRPETTEFTRRMGATHVINHHDDLAEQLDALKLDVPLKYAFITHTPNDEYVRVLSDLVAPFGKICSIVQGPTPLGPGIRAMGKSLSYHWCLIGTKPYYGIDLESHGSFLKKLTGLIEAGKIKSHMTRILPLSVDGLKEAHSLVEGGKEMGKICLSVEKAGDDSFR
ncbi:MAG: hypothetical protein M1818_000608 [Claussenomyces sp. TS43310]|nr:MAG: hypothetical protein M1818_000608 [Claussenomyces sp. TS43310]